MRLEPVEYGMAVGMFFWFLTAGMLLLIHAWWFPITRDQYNWIMNIGPCAGIIGYFIRRARPPEWP